MPFRSGGSSGGGGGSGTVTSVAVAADSGSGSAITSAGTISILGGSGVTTSVSGTTVTVTSGGSSALTTVTKDTSDSPYTVSSEDVVFCDVSGGSLIVNFPTTATDGRVIRVVDLGSASPSGNQVTISGNGNTIAGESTQTINSQYQSIMAVGNGSNWFLL